MQIKHSAAILILSIGMLLTCTLGIHAQNWTQRGVDIDGESITNASGWSVSLNENGNTLIVGDPLNDDNGHYAGQIRAYSRDLFGGQAGDLFGFDVEMDGVGNVIAAGAPGADAGYARVYFWYTSTYNPFWQIAFDTAGEAAGDSAGYSIGLSKDSWSIAVGAPGNDGNGSGSGHVRIYRRNAAWSWAQKGNDIDGEMAGDRSGHTVAISETGNVVAIGAPGNDGNGNNSGHVRVYSWNGSQWVQAGNDIDGVAAGDQFGWSIALNDIGDRVTIGAPGNDDAGVDAGQTRVFEFVAGAWVQLGNTVDGLVAGDRSGSAVDISQFGNRIAIGAYLNDIAAADAGLTTVYELNGSTWDQVGNLIKEQEAGGWFGFSVALDFTGLRVAVGTPLGDRSGYNASYAGYAEVFSLTTDVWTLNNKTTGEASAGMLGSANDLSMNGKTIVIGAPEMDFEGGNTGATYILDWIDGSWVQRGSKIIGEDIHDFSGGAVAIGADGDIIATGARLNLSDTSGKKAGHVRVFNWDGVDWAQMGDDIDGKQADEFFGVDVALSSDGSIMAAGATRNNTIGNYAGAVRVYEWTGSYWSQKGADIFGDAAGDRTGFAVSLNGDGNVLAVGAPNNDAMGPSSGQTRIFEWNGTSWIQKGGDIVGLGGDHYNGWAVSLSDDGNTVVTTDKGHHGSTSYEGLLRVFDFDGSSWVQRGNGMTGDFDKMKLGHSVDISADGNLVIAGSSDTGSDDDFRGLVPVYKWIDTAWIRQGNALAGEYEDDRFGYSVSTDSSGNAIAIGAIHNGDGGEKSGHVRVFDFGCPYGVSRVHNVNSCDPYTWENGITYSTSNNSAKDTILSTSGCDTFLFLNLTIGNFILQGTDQITTCGPYTWIDGETYASSNYSAKDTLVSSLGCDSIVTLNLTIAPLTSTEIVSACDSFTWSNGITYFSNNITDSDTFLTAAGCDSIVTLNLTVHSLNRTVVTNDMTLISLQAGLSNLYQWLDCDSGFLPIPGATSFSFTPATTGFFAVDVSDQNTCRDTSECVFVNVVGIPVNGNQHMVRLYPNPFSEQMTVEFNSIQEKVDVTIQNVLGQVTLTGSYTKQQHIQLNIPGESGIYFIELGVPDEGIEVFKIIKD